ncbi:hypothetical protein G6662_05855 [Polynucleobacter paneuropaeus]|jgi:hypothetical protein|nr:hypothetical protein [Polynucleobacter paneuropaeus]
MSFDWNARFKVFKAINILYAITVVQVINVIFYIYFLWKNRFLPAPFIMDKADTFMDFYNPLFWVINGGFYSAFDSFYPALNYFFLRLFSFGISPGFIDDPRLLRDSSPVISIALITLYCLIVFLVTNIGEWKRVKSSHGVIISIACVLSVPVLFALERANLIFLSLLVLGLYLNASSKILRAVLLAILINIKPYYLVFFLPFINLNKFNFKFIAITLFFTLFLFLSLGFLAGININGYFQSLYKFSNNNSLPLAHVISMPHTLDALLLPMQRLQAPIKSMQEIAFLNALPFEFLYSIVRWINPLTILILILISVYKKLSDLELLISSFIVLTNLSVSTGGYILIIYIVLIPYLIQSPEYRKLLLPILTIFFIPIDWIKVLPLHLDETTSYLGSAYLMNIDYYIGLGSITRPMANYGLMVWFAWLLYTKYGSLFPIRHMLG